MSRFQSFLFEEDPLPVRRSKVHVIQEEPEVNVASTAKEKPIKYDLVASLHEPSTSDVPVLVETGALPGIDVGDLALLYKKPNSGEKVKHLIFEVKNMDDYIKERVGNKIQISLLNNNLPLHLGVTKSSKVCVKRIRPQDFRIDLLEVYIKDIHLSRGDMWVISNYIVHNLKCCYVGQNLTVFNFVNLTVSKLHIKNTNVFSGIVFPETTKIVFRSKSSKLTFIIQLSSDMLHFDPSGSMIYNRILQQLFPTMYQNWSKMNADHLITIILFTSIVDNNDEQLLNCRLGDTFKNSQDYYRIVVDQVNLNNWEKIMINLKYEILKFKEDIDLINRQLLPSSKGNILQALDFSAVFMLNTMSNLTSLKHTQHHFMLITPGTGLFDIDFNAFDHIVKKITKLDVSIDLICLGAPPAHHTPMFRYRDDLNKLVYRFPTWFNCFFWLNNKFVNTFHLMSLERTSLNDLFRSSEVDKYEGTTISLDTMLRCKLYDLQMMGVMEYEISGLEIPYLPSPTDPKISFVKEYIEDYEKFVYKFSSDGVTEDKIDTILSTASNEKYQTRHLCGYIERIVESNESWMAEKLKNGSADSKKDTTNSEISEVTAPVDDKSTPSDEGTDQEIKKSENLESSALENSESKTSNSKTSLRYTDAPFKDSISLSQPVAVAQTEAVSSSHSNLDGSVYRRLKENQKEYQSSTFRDDASSLISALSGKANTKSKNGSLENSIDSTYSTQSSSTYLAGSMNLKSISNMFYNLANFGTKKSSDSHDKSSGSSRPTSQASIKDPKKFYRNAPDLNPSNSSSKQENNSPGKSNKAKVTDKARSSVSSGKKRNSTSSDGKSVSNSDIKKNHTSRFVLKNERMKLRGNLEKQMKSVPNLQKDKASHNFIQSKKQPPDLWSYLGILIKEPMKLSEHTLEFASLNFGKWDNIYPTTVNEADNKPTNFNKTLQARGSYVTPEDGTLAQNTAKSSKKRIPISWKSLICPASLPITTKHFPYSVSEYVLGGYDILPNSKFKHIVDSKDLLKEMIYARLMMGFQICDTSSQPFWRHFEKSRYGLIVEERNIFLMKTHLPPDYKAGSYNPVVYMSIMDEVHRLFLDFFGSIKVQIFKNQADRTFNKSADSNQGYGNNYKPFIRTRYDTSYHQIDFRSPMTVNSSFNWTKIDNYLAGNFDEQHADFKYGKEDQISLYQIRLVVMKNLPVDEKMSSDIVSESRHDSVSFISNATELGSGHCKNIKQFLEFVKKDEHKSARRKFSRLFDDEDEESEDDDEDESESDNDLEGSNELSGSASATTQRKLKSMLIDIDPNRRSHKSEILKIFYDDLNQISDNINGYEQCFHIRLQWLTTTPKLIDDLISKWAIACETNSLKLVEVPPYEIYQTPSMNPFHTVINIPFILNPWDHQEKYFSGTQIKKYYYHDYILRLSGFCLDEGNQNMLNTDVNTDNSGNVSLKGSNDNPESSQSRGGAQEQGFKYLQYIHKTGVYLAEIKTNGDFFLVPNNTYISKLSLRKQTASKGEDRSKVYTSSSGKYFDTSSLDSSHLALSKTDKDLLKFHYDDNLQSDSQSIMVSLFKKCNNTEYLKALFDQAKSDWSAQAGSPDLENSFDINNSKSIDITDSSLSR